MIERMLGGEIYHKGQSEFSIFLKAHEGVVKEYEAIMAEVKVMTEDEQRLIPGWLILDKNDQRTFTLHPGPGGMRLELDVPIEVFYSMMEALNEMTGATNA